MTDAFERAHGFGRFRGLEDLPLDLVAVFISRHSFPHFIFNYVRDYPEGRRDVHSQVVVAAAVVLWVRMVIHHDARRSVGLRSAHGPQPSRDQLANNVLQTAARSVRIPFMSMSRSQ